MKEKEFKKLIKKSKYQVFLFQSPASLPFSLFVHYWFVCVEKGKISRWEVLFRKWKGENHLYLNFFPPTLGIEIIPFYNKFSWEGTLKYSLEGDNQSVAKKMIDFIKKSKNSYPYKKQWSALGPNSNTFIQWVINKFQGCRLKLSWRAIGMNYNSP